MSTVVMASAPAPAIPAVTDVPMVRISPDNATVSANLGLLKELAGSWHGHGFNLIGRPDAQNGQNVYLQVNQTEETIKIDPIGSSIPNRGFGQNDIEMFGLTYLQKISDVFTGGALHIEPGIWVTQPSTTYPPETDDGNSQIIFRMGSIPHGNSLLAQGTARSFTGKPVVASATAPYSFSDFPSFNTTPFPAVPQVINAPGTSETANAAVVGAPPFLPYDLGTPSGPGNPRTPFGTNPPDPALPSSIRGVPMQTVINDPITVLQAVIEEQAQQGCTFEGTVLNISTQATVTFRNNPNDPTGPTSTINPKNGAGGVENILFLEGGEPVGAVGPNADTVTVYATFWIEKVMHPSRPHFIQLQYAQCVVLNFPVFAGLHPPPPTLPILFNVGWPHVSVATLKKTFH